MDTSQAPRIRFEPLQHLPGFAAGLQQRPVLCRVQITGAAQYAVQIGALKTALMPHLPAPPDLLRTDRPVSSDAEAFLGDLADLVALLLVGAGIPVLDPPHIRSPDAEQGRHDMLIPSYSGKATTEALSRVMALLPRAREDLDWDAALAPVFAALIPFAPPGRNTNVMMMKAAARRIPVTRDVLAATRFGWGVNGQMYRGAIGERTGRLAADIANDKRRTHLALREAGLPVAEQHWARTRDAALSRAEEMGYPVVLKAPMMEAGHGVAADLRDEEALRAAYARLAEKTQALVIERHEPGVIYRVNVLDGVVICVGHRTPAAVTGDGTHSVAELIEIANRDPRRSRARFAPLEPLALTETAQRHLDRQGLTPEDVPEAGRFVALGIRTDRKEGGDNRIVAADKVHPDNARLAMRAAETLRLDIAGVDLLLPDISRSWRDTGGVVCEVNSNPGLSFVGGEVLDVLLDRLPDNGRIPVDVVIGAGDEDARTLRDGLAASQGAAVIESGRLEISGYGRFDLPGIHAATQAAMFDPDVTRMVIVTDMATVAAEGLMVDRADRLWAIGDALTPEAKAVFGPLVGDMQMIGTAAALLKVL